MCKGMTFCSCVSYVLSCFSKIAKNCFLRAQCTLKTCSDTFRNDSDMCSMQKCVRIEYQYILLDFTANGSALAAHGSGAPALQWGCMNRSGYKDKFEYAIT